MSLERSSTALRWGCCGRMWGSRSRSRGTGSTGQGPFPQGLCVGMMRAPHSLVLLTAEGSGAAWSPVSSCSLLPHSGGARVVAGGTVPTLAASPQRAGWVAAQPWPELEGKPRPRSGLGLTGRE